MPLLPTHHFTVQQLRWSKNHDLVFRAGERTVPMTTGLSLSSAVFPSHPFPAAILALQGLPFPLLERILTEAALLKRVVQGGLDEVLPQVIYNLLTFDIPDIGCEFWVLTEETQPENPLS